MNETEIQEEIWQIIEKELKELRWHSIRNTLPKDYDRKQTLVEYFLERIKKQTNELLNKHEAILVYQP